MHDNLATLVGAGLDTFWPSDLPAQVQLMVGVRLVGFSDEFTTERKHVVSNRVKDPSGETLNEMREEFVIAADNGRPDFLTGVILPLALRFDAGQEGTYAVELEFDEAWISFPIHAMRGLPNAA